MLTLYSDQGSGNCYKVRLLLYHCDIPFRVVDMDVVEGDPRKPEAVAKNPIGKIPFLEFDDGRVLSESPAILYYFAQGTQYWPTDAWEQANVLRWMAFEQYVHEPNIAVARFWCHYLNAEDDHAEQLVEKRKKGYAALDIMENHLADREFFTAAYSIADIALYAYTHVSHQGGFSLDNYPAIRRWMERVANQERHLTITDTLGRE